MPPATRPALPTHPSKRYPAVGRCIYCGSAAGLTEEHIVPYALGGRWVLPESSCKACSKITGKFEGQLCRTILGPLRMLFNMPTRRPKERPRHLPLKVKYPTSTDWDIAYVHRDVCPFLIGLPLYPTPDALTGQVTQENRTAATSQIWLRGGGFWNDRDKHLQWLCEMLGAVQVMPEAHIPVEPFCLTLLRIAHAFSVAELGLNGFKPFLTEMIRERDLSNRAQVLGGGAGNERPGDVLHEVGFKLRKYSRQRLRCRFACCPFSELRPTRWRSDPAWPNPAH